MTVICEGDAAMEWTAADQAAAKERLAALSAKPSVSAKNKTRLIGAAIVAVPLGFVTLVMTLGALNPSPNASPSLATVTPVASPHTAASASSAPPAAALDLDHMHVADVQTSLKLLLPQLGAWSDDPFPNTAYFADHRAILTVDAGAVDQDEKDQDRTRFGRIRFLDGSTSKRSIADEAAAAAAMIRTLDPALTDREVADGVQQVKAALRAGDVHEVDVGRYAEINTINNGDGGLGGVGLTGIRFDHTLLGNDKPKQVYVIVPVG